MGPPQAQTELRIGFFPGPYADQFKRGVQPYLEARASRSRPPSSPTSSRSTPR
jgi:hypothetical protein